MRTVQREFVDFKIASIPNINEMLINFHNKKYSTKKITKELNAQGYLCSSTAVWRYCKHIGLKFPVWRFKSDSDNPMLGKFGSLSPFWKGGKTIRTELFYNSLEWRNKRFEIMQRDNFSCMNCGTEPTKVRRFLNVHHIIPLSKNWNLRLKDTNLITLCKHCHKITSGTILGSAIRKEVVFKKYFKSLLKDNNIEFRKFSGIWRALNHCRTPEETQEIIDSL